MTQLKQAALNISNRDVLLIMSGFAIGTAFGSLLLAATVGNVTFTVWLEGFLQNFSTEMFGGFLTFLLIEVLIVTRKERETQQRRKEEARQEHAEEIDDLRSTLVRRLGSRVNSEAMLAAEELRHHGWWDDGTLDDVNISGANLRNVSFARARLRRVRLHGANISEASFYYADLQGAFLVGVDARETIFRGADISGAYMQGANLAGVASLTPDQLTTATRLKGATMPDGSRYDGRYNLWGDLKQAREKGFDVESTASLAAYYKVPHEVFIDGQRQAAHTLTEGSAA